MSIRGLRELRISRGLTQDQLAGRAGISQCLVSWHESGRKALSEENLRKVARVLRGHVDPEPGEPRRQRHVTRGVRYALRARTHEEHATRARATRRMLRELGFDAAMDELQRMGRERRRLVEEVEG